MNMKGKVMPAHVLEGTQPCPNSKIVLVAALPPGHQLLDAGRYLALAFARTGERYDTLVIIGQDDTAPNILAADVANRCNSGNIHAWPHMPEGATLNARLREVFPNAEQLFRLAGGFRAAA